MKPRFTPLLRTLVGSAVALLLTVTAHAAPIEVPIDVAVGPAGLWFTGDVGHDQLAHGGLKIRLEAIISHQLIQANINRVPEKYRKMALGLTEVRYRPSIFIPEELIISPKWSHTGMYGASWRPLQLELTLVSGRAPLGLSAGLDLSAAFIHSDNLGFDWMFFLRPGLDLQLEWEIPVASTLHVSVGWQSALYLPQPLGGGVFSLGGFDDRSIWHVGQVFILFHGFTTYKANL